MVNPAKIEPPLPNDRHSYSAAVRSVLGFTALVITLLPIPALVFGILPAYEKHAWFLLFYTPFMCLLTLCYLFYIRDSLARVSFADLLDPPPPPDPYASESVGEQLRRAFRRVKAVALGILPAVLVVISMYCIVRYFAALDQSVAISVYAYTESAARDTIPAVPDKREKQPRSRSTRAGASQERATATDTTVDSLTQDSLARATPPNPSDTSAVREYVLRTSEVDNIPRLLQLTGFYVGAFLALLIAVTLMALKEYAKEALGLSEHELMFGRYRRPVPEE